MIKKGEPIVIQRTENGYVEHNPNCPSPFWCDSFTLSRRMCEALQFVAMDRDRQGALPNIPQLSTMHALEERGLIERNQWRLSQAGRLLYPLLAHAGLVEAGAAARPDVCLSICE